VTVEVSDLSALVVARSSEAGAALERTASSLQDRIDERVALVTSQSEEAMDAVRQQSSRDRSELQATLCDLDRRVTVEVSDLSALVVARSSEAGAALERTASSLQQHIGDSMAVLVLKQDRLKLGFKELRVGFDEHVCRISVQMNEVVLPVSRQLRAEITDLALSVTEMRARLDSTVWEMQIRMHNDADTLMRELALCERRLDGRIDSTREMGASELLPLREALTEIDARFTQLESPVVSISTDEVAVRGGVKTTPLEVDEVADLLGKLRAQYAELGARVDVFDVTATQLCSRQSAEDKASMSTWDVQLLLDAESTELRASMNQMNLALSERVTHDVAELAAGQVTDAVVACTSLERTFAELQNALMQEVAKLHACFSAMTHKLEQQQRAPFMAPDSISVVVAQTQEQVKTETNRIRAEMSAQVQRMDAQFTSLSARMQDDALETSTNAQLLQQRCEAMETLAKQTTEQMVALDHRVGGLAERMELALAASLREAGRLQAAVTEQPQASPNDVTEAVAALASHMTCEHAASAGALHNCFATLDAQMQAVAGRLQVAEQAAQTLDSQLQTNRAETVQLVQQLQGLAAQFDGVVAATVSMAANQQPTSGTANTNATNVTLAVELGVLSGKTEATTQQVKDLAAAVARLEKDASAMALEALELRVLDLAKVGVERLLTEHGASHVDMPMLAAVEKRCHEQCEAHVRAGRQHLESFINTSVATQREALLTEVAAWNASSVCDNAAAASALHSTFAALDVRLLAVEHTTHFNANTLASLQVTEQSVLSEEMQQQVAALRRHVDRQFALVHATHAEGAAALAQVAGEQAATTALLEAVGSALLERVEHALAGVQAQLGMEIESLQAHLAQLSAVDVASPALQAELASGQRLVREGLSTLTERLDDEISALRSNIISASADVKTQLVQELIALQGTGEAEREVPANGAVEAAVGELATQWAQQLRSVEAALAEETRQLRSTLDQQGKVWLDRLSGVEREMKVVCDAVEQQDTQPQMIAALEDLQKRAHDHAQVTQSELAELRASVLTNSGGDDMEALVDRLEACERALGDVNATTKGGVGLRMAQVERQLEALLTSLVGEANAGTTDGAGSQTGSIDVAAAVQLAALHGAQEAATLRVDGLSSSVTSLETEARHTMVLLNEDLVEVSERLAELEGVVWGNAGGALSAFALPQRLSTMEDAVRMLGARCASSEEQHAQAILQQHLDGTQHKVATHQLHNAVAELGDKVAALAAHPTLITTAR
jgi:hypothetical protein